MAGAGHVRPTPHPSRARRLGGRRRAAHAATAARVPGGSATLGRALGLSRLGERVVVDLAEIPTARRALQAALRRRDTAPRAVRLTRRFLLPQALQQAHHATSRSALDPASRT